MQTPRINPRRLFWSCILAACVWAMLGGRSASQNPREASPSILYRTQSLFGEVISTILTPAKFIFTSIQSVGTSAVDHATTRRDESESLDSLHLTIAQLNDQLDQRDRQIRLDQELFTAQNSLAPQGLHPDELLVAGVTGYQAAPGASLLTLDKGSADAIRQGMVVTACSTIRTIDPATKQTVQGTVPQASILGMIESTLAKTSTVRLLTDPRMKVQAKLVRRSPQGSTVLTPDPCLVEGIGDGKLRCNTISVNETLDEPQPGDLVQLADKNWPASVRYMVIGEVATVARKDTQLLRYDLIITPRMNLNSVGTVLVVLKQ